jgi:hypothetical protein
MVRTLLAMVVSHSLIDRPDPEMKRVELFGSQDKLLIFKSSSSRGYIINTRLTFLELHGAFSIGVDIPEIDA